MVDIRSEKWLWIKGGLFVVISLLSLGLLLLELSNTKQVVLVFVSIWACCRAYYFAFYVIEKYIDSRFRFSGLLYLPQYMWQRHHGTIPSEADQTRESKPLSWYVFWPCVFVVGNFVEPSFYGLLFRAGFDLSHDFLSIAVAGAISTQIAFSAVASSSLGVPLKLAIPCSIGFIWLLTATFFMGCVFAGTTIDRELAVAACLYLPILYVLTFGILSFTLSLLGMQWSPEKQWSPLLPTGKKQLSIRYLLAATAVVAILCVTIKATGIAFGFLTQNEFPAIMLAYVFGSLPVICLFSLVLVVTLTTLSLTRRWILHGSLAIFVAAMPLLLHGLIEFVFKLFLSQSFPAIKMDDMLQCYCFVGGFTVSLFVILLHARLQGLRLSFPQSASASVNSVARHSVP